MSAVENQNVRELLDELVLRYNVPEFAKDDPVQFARRFDSLPDREIASLLVSTISWGRRPMILRDAERLLGMMENRPHDFVLNGPIEEIDPAQNIHRTFFGRHLQYWLRGLREIYTHYPTLEAFAAACGATKDGQAPAWTLAKALNGVLHDANDACQRANAADQSRCLPAKTDNSALKRLNMALRWLVRDDGIVDPGGWTAIKPAQLYIPMDVHVCRQSAQLGLLPCPAAKTPSPDRKKCESLTATLRDFRPDDPTVYDFALFGYGVNQTSQ